MLEKARLEADTKALKSQLQDIQRYLAKTMWGLLVPGGATSFNMAWPAVRNHRTYRRTRNGNFQEWDPYKLWLDKSQLPRLGSDALVRMELLVDRGLTVGAV
jgi:hypothetical protein